MPFYNTPLRSGDLAGVISDCYEFVGRRATIELLDDMNQLGFRESTRSGLSFATDDLVTPDLLDHFEALKEDPLAIGEVHSEGELENFVSKNIDKRRVYINLDENMVYSVNTQYAGNTVGLKKLALRLAIQKASAEGWLAECHHIPVG